MPVKVQCSSCKKVLSAPDKARGKTLKCPQCQNPIKVPSGEKKPAKQADDGGFDDDLFSDLDLRQIEDRVARVCPKCGVQVGEEDFDCPSCGADIQPGMGGGTRRRKKGASDTSKFYKKAWGNAWAFVKKNKGIAIRSSIYMFLFTLLALGAGFMVIWSSNMPPRVFWGFITLVMGLVPLGWPWYLTSITIPATMNNKNELKHVHFDMFTCVSLGIKLFAWTIVMGFPFLAATCVPAYFMWDGGNAIAAGILVALGLAITFSMLPVALAHMSMPVTSPGWLIHRVVPGWGKSLGGCLFTWLLIFVVSLPVLGCLGGAAAGYGNRLVRWANDLQSNGKIELAKEWKSETKEEQEPAWVTENKSKTPVEIQWDVLIVPGILIGVATVISGIPIVFGARMMGQFCMYFKGNLDLDALEKQAVYVKKEPKFDKDGNPIDPSETPVWLKWTVGVGGTITFYVVVNIITYNFFDGMLILPRPIAKMMNLVEQE